MFIQILITILVSSSVPYSDGYMKTIIKIKTALIIVNHSRSILLIDGPGHDHPDHNNHLRFITVGLVVGVTVTHSRAKES